MKKQTPQKQQQLSSISSFSQQSSMFITKVKLICEELNLELILQLQNTNSLNDITQFLISHKTISKNSDMSYFLNKNESPLGRLTTVGQIRNIVGSSQDNLHRLTLYAFIKKKRESVKEYENPPIYMVQDLNQSKKKSSQQENTSIYSKKDNYEQSYGQFQKKKRQPVCDKCQIY